MMMRCRLWCDGLESLIVRAVSRFRGGITPVRIIPTVSTGVSVSSMGVRGLDDVGLIILLVVIIVVVIIFVLIVELMTTFVK